MLSNTTRKWLKGLHLSFAALCMGGTAAILALQYMKYCLGDVLDHLTAEISVHYLWTWAVAAPFYGLLASGLVISLFTQWGFIRYPWVTVKWVWVLALFLLNWFWLGPAADGMVALADGYFSIEGALDLYKILFRQASWAAAVQLTILLTLLFLSVFKPWGKREKAGTGRPVLVRTVALVLIVMFLGMGILNALSLNRYRTMEISRVTPDDLPDGIYPGQAADSSFTYQVEVTVEDGFISSIKTVKTRESLYARYAEGVFERVMNQQTPGVDTITGATTTSKVLLKAVENALTGGLDSKE
jgi:uncharacterized protein with FMN-binding domain